MPIPAIPNDFPLDAIVGQELTQVCIGQANVVLHFYKLADAASSTKTWEPGASISIESGFELKQAEAEIESANNGELALRSGTLGRLLGQFVFSSQLLERNELLVRFSNDYSLRLLTDSCKPESFHISLNHDLFVFTSTSILPF